MAYVRKKGNQVVIVHGVRDSETKEVQQKTLFVFYSKAEALAAIGDSATQFQNTLESDFPDIKFDWKKIRDGLHSCIDVLPDLYQYKSERVESQFRLALTSFAKELLICDPQSLITSAGLLQEQRVALEYIRELIDWRLQQADQKPTKWNQDNPFYWRTMAQRRDVPIEGVEELSDLYLRREYEKAEMLATLLTDCWSHYAEGYNYLGLIALNRNDRNTALSWFEKARQTGRSLFPRRIAKDRYWTDHDTRPYIRAHIYLAQTHNQLGNFETALKHCEELEKECHLDIFAALERTPIFLNMGDYLNAAKAARYVCGLYPQENLLLALALYEAGERSDARVHFLAGAIRYPRTAQMLASIWRARVPKASREIGDHNLGVEYLNSLDHYLRRRSPRSKRFFKEILKNKSVQKLLHDAEIVRSKWFENRGANREWFKRMNEMESLEFAKAKVLEIWPEKMEE